MNSRSFAILSAGSSKILAGIEFFSGRLVNMQDKLLESLERRLGRLHTRQRLGIEADFEAKVFTFGAHFFHLENWYSIHSLIKTCLRLAGLYRRGQRNAADVRLQHNEIELAGLPDAFDGFRLLHLSDLHVDMDSKSTEALIGCISDIDYDLCVLTGDYRASTFGGYERSLAGMARVADCLKAPVYGVLGNHDSVRMVPALEEMGIRMLLNESAVIDREGASIYLVGIDDAHYFRVDNIEKAAEGVPPEAVSILLSHTPEIYRQAAYADFDLLLCGHTHGGQICLPGGYPITLDANCPRYMGSGPWKYHKMTGYTSTGAGTSIVNVRLNCPAEATLHRLTRPVNKGGPGCAT